MGWERKVDHLLVVVSWTWSCLVLGLDLELDLELSYLVVSCPISPCLLSSFHFSFVFLVSSSLYVSVLSCVVCRVLCVCSVYYRNIILPCLVHSLSCFSHVCCLAWFGDFESKIYLSYKKKSIQTCPASSMVYCM